MQEYWVNDIWKQGAPVRHILASSFEDMLKVFIKREKIILHAPDECTSIDIRVKTSKQQKKGKVYTVDLEYGYPPEYEELSQ